MAERARRTRSNLRNRALVLVGLLVCLSLLGSMVSLVRITEVNRSLDAINRVSVPVGKVISQLQNDVQIYRREAERGLSSANWSDPRWKVRPIPKWVNEVIEGELGTLRDLLAKDLPWVSEEARSDMRNWFHGLEQSWSVLNDTSGKLVKALESRNQNEILMYQPEMLTDLEDFSSKSRWGLDQYDRILRQTFSQAENRVSDLRASLQIILIVVVALSFLLLWFSERALRPLAELTALARNITARGLKRDDKFALPALNLSRNDEVSQLAREFHRMATTLLEREKVVETQNARLQDQNLKLRKMQELQDRLRVAEHMAAMGRMSAQVAHEVRNPLHSIGLETELALDLATQAGHLQLKQALQSVLQGVERLEKITENYLKLSKLSPGERKKMDLRDVLESVLATYATSCQQKQIQVDWKINSKAPLYIKGDEDLLEQAIGNLVRNSIQALQGVSESKIYCTAGLAESGRLFVRIEDNGPGIAAEVRSKLFTPFVTTWAQGTGLGLSFVKKVIDDHGGSIHYVDRSQGGACFDLFFPPFDELNVKSESESKNEREARVEG